MGIKTKLTLKEAQKLFNDFNIDTLEATSSGVVDTTYLSKEYVIKKYEREVELQEDIKLLKLLAQHNLNTPKYLASKNSWHLYSRLKGEGISKVRYYHLQSVAKFLRKFHSLSFQSKRVFYNAKRVKEALNKLFGFSYYYKKKLEGLENYHDKQECFIHGDIFLDNVLFDGRKIAVFDFIDGGMGSCCFEAGVVLVAFGGVEKRSFIKYFLNVYNQTNKKKLKEQEVLECMEVARKYYALFRFVEQKDLKKGKKLL